MGLSEQEVELVEEIRAGWSEVLRLRSIAHEAKLASERAEQDLTRAYAKVSNALSKLLQSSAEVPSAVAPGSTEQTES